MVNLNTLFKILPPNAINLPYLNMAFIFDPINTFIY